MKTPLRHVIVIMEARKFLLLEADDVQIQSLKVKSELNLKIWDKDNEYKLYPEIKEKLIGVAEYFIKFCGFDDLGISPRVKDIILTGSLANYNWSAYSDVDVHIIMDFSQLDDLTKKVLLGYLEMKKKIFAEQHDIRILSHDVEMYVQDDIDGLIALGIYSLVSDSWIKFPEKYQKEIEWEIVKRKALSYMHEIDDIERIVNFGSVKSYESQLEKLHAIWKKIKSDRRAGLEQSGEFSVENLIFKILRRNNYIGKILGLRSKLISDKLSFNYPAQPQS